MDNSSKNDWVTGALQDLEKVNINMELSEIIWMPEERFNNICKQKVKSLAIEYLNNKIETKAKL